MGRSGMGRSGFAVAMLAFLSASPALGQYADVVQACREDAKLRCPTTQPGGGQVAECLKANFQALSEPCKAALVGVAAVRQACKADVAQQCPDIKPGAGRL